LICGTLLPLDEETILNSVEKDQQVFGGARRHEGRAGSPVKIAAMLCEEKRLAIWTGR